MVDVADKGRGQVRPAEGDAGRQQGWRFARASLDYPETTQPITISWEYAIALALVHVLALLAFIPWLFSWTGVVVAIAGHFLFGMMGITVGYHRLLTHQGFVCPKWFEHILAILGICTLQDSPARWVAIHRVHHKHSDEQRDPHSPLVSFLWGHMGWILVQNRDHRNVNCYERYVRDLLRDPFYLRLERHALWLGVYAMHALLFLVLGFLVGWALTGTLVGGLQLGLSILVWGVFVRTVFVLHGTWAVNSVTHIWGYRNYETSDNSRNNWFVALLAHGEGWHNNHHADQRAAAHGHRWWEFDMSWWVIRGLEKIGLARNIIRPRVWSDKQWLPK
jgi:stearoyl-CoA desaturase (delta-9 desaturase)